MVDVDRIGGSVIDHVREAHVTRLAVALFGGLLAFSAHAQPRNNELRWPERPIRLVVPFTPGSSSDIVARLMAQKLGERLHQQLFVENRVGASGNVGTEAVARAEPDGYTLGLANTSTHAVAAALAAASYDPVKDFAPVSMLGNSPFVLALYPGVRAAGVHDLVALAQARPRVLNYASAGPATLAHLAGALFEKMAKIELTHVPYRGTAQSTLDLIEGRVEMAFATLPPTLTHIRSGKLRALAVTGAARNPALPDVPTIAESGLPGYECSLWQAIVAPAGTPPSVVERLNREITASLRDADIIAAFAKQGIEPEPGSPAALERRIRDDMTKWRDVIASAGIRAN
jgi:tripartite-type tricarboxylate transporter receptor subunit TctC